MPFLPREYFFFYFYFCVGYCLRAFWPLKQCQSVVLYTFTSTCFGEYKAVVEIPRTDFPINPSWKVVGTEGEAKLLETLKGHWKGALESSTNQTFG